MSRVSLLVPMAACLLVGTLSADEVRLSDGRVLVGPTKNLGKKLQVKTLDGVVVVPRQDVIGVRTDEQLRAELASLAARTDDTLFGSLQLARTARDWGLYDEMWERIESCLGQVAAGTADDARLRAFLVELEPVVLPRKWRKTPTDTRVRELIYRVKPGASQGLLASVEAILAVEPGAAESLQRRARSSSRPAQRLVAARALARSADEGNDRFLYRTAIIDQSAEVRTGAARAISERGETGAALHYLAPGLLHSSPTVRIRTAEAFGHMGDGGAIDLLVAAGPRAGTPASAAGDNGSVRGHVAIIDQEAYIRDFDVEVAQASFIADPKVSVLQSGVVLDTTVQAVISYRTEIVRAYRGALNHLAGSDPGYDPRQWEAWRETQRQQPAKR